MTQSTEQDLTHGATDAALADSVKKAVCVFLDGLIAAGGDSQEKAACLARLETALKTYKEGHRSSKELISQVFSESAAA